MDDENRERHRLLQDLDHYVQTHGLEALDPNELSEQEYKLAQKRIAEAEQYQASVHASIFEEGASGKEKEMKRQCFLENLNADTIDFQTSNGSIRYLPLRPLAEACDTIYALASSREMFQTGKEESKSHLQFSLEAFESTAVREFVDLVLKKKNIEDVSCDFVVDCCQIAHYVQCNPVLDSMVDILVRSIDSDNCLSLCELGDRLNLGQLFESSLSFMMQSLQSLDEFPGLTDELKQRIDAIRSVIQSSVHLQRKQLYCGSFEEYLAIFAENIQYHQERLEEAKLGLEEAESDKAFQYIEQKIEQQENRVKTLRAVMREQKKLFGKSADSRNEPGKNPNPEVQFRGTSSSGL